VDAYVESVTLSFPGSTEAPRQVMQLKDLSSEAVHLRIDTGGKSCKSRTDNYNGIVVGFHVYSSVLVINKFLYSLDKVFTGLTRAVFIERELIVMSAITKVITNETINGITVAQTKGDNPNSIR